MEIAHDDLQMVADRLGLTSADVPEILSALNDVTRLGLEAFLDDTLQAAASTLIGAYAGQHPSEATIRRAQIRPAHR